MSILNNTYNKNISYFTQDELEDELQDELEDHQNIEYLENIENNYLNNRFMKFIHIISIIGLLFYLTISIGNINYDKLLQNKTISFTLNVIFVLSLMLSLIY
jgi:hypothetical protein